MNKLLRYLFIVITACIFSGCGKEKPVLHVYNWVDYMNPDLIPEFEEKFDCQVVVDHFDSNEAMYAKIKAGAAGYDLIFPSSYMVSIMRKQKMLYPMDAAKIPNLKNIDPAFMKLTEDSGMEYSVPYMIGVTGIGYVQSAVGDVTSSWSIFSRSDLAGRMTMLDDSREVIGAALKFLGYSLNTTDPTQLEEAKKVLLEWKKNLAKYESTLYHRGLASQEFLVAQGYNGDVLQVAEEAPEVAFMLPEEGTSVASDDMVIPADAPNKELAFAFINFLLEPEVASRNMQYVYYEAPNKPAIALLPQDMLDDPSFHITPEYMAKCEVIKDLGNKNELYQKLWDQIKGAQ